MSKKGTANAVTVGVRIRPRNSAELAADMPAVFEASEEGNLVNELEEASGDLTKAWPFDHVFGNECDNQFIFETVGKGLVESALDGYNTVMFMYGQTSSGKTFTLFGGGPIKGVVDHCMGHVSKVVQESTDKEYIIKLQYAELYNEELKDLLSESPNDNLRVIEDPLLGPIVQNITEKHFTNHADVRKLLEEGENRRHFGVTNMNAHSSRSHVLVRLAIEIRKVTSKPDNPLRTSWGRDKPTSISTLNLVDLAGSERASKSGTSGESLKEGSFINKSLLTLGTVIASLTDPKKSKHVPYRDSKLTRLLATALGGNAKTCMLTCISPASGNSVESLSTLRFASRAKRIVNTVQKNELAAAKKVNAKLSAQQAEIEKLQQQIEESKKLGFVQGDGKGESIREKAISSEKKFRTLRFLMVTVPRIVRSFKAMGQDHLAKQVQSDMSEGLAGKKDLESVMETATDLVQKNLPDEQELLEKMEGVMQTNESNDFETFLSEPDVTDLPEGSVGQGSSVEEEHGMVIDLASADLTDKLEKLTAEHEDLQSKFQHQEHVNKKLMQESTSMKEFHATTDSERKAVISGLKSDLEESRKAVERLEDDVQGKAERIAIEANKYESLDVKYSALTKELEQANVLRKSYEHEVVRIKNESKQTIEKLRGNMRNVLQEGGESVKYLEQNNTQLQKELDLRNEAIENLKVEIENKDGEIHKIREELHKSFDESKARTDEIYLVKEQLQKVQDKLIETQNQLAESDTKLELSKEEMRINEQNMASEVQTKEAELEEHKESMASKMKVEKDKLGSLTSKCNTLEARIKELTQEVDLKNIEMKRLEKELSTIVGRYENRLDNVNKSKDSSAAIMEQSMLKYQEESSQLQVALNEEKSRNSELQRYIDDIQNYFNDITGAEDTAALSENDYEDSFDDDEGDVAIDTLGESVESYRDDATRDFSRTHASESGNVEDDSETDSIDGDAEAWSDTATSFKAESKANDLSIGSKLPSASLSIDLGRYHKLRSALSVAFTGLNFALKDENLMRNFLLDEQSSGMNQIMTYEAQIESERLRAAASSKYKKHLESTLHSLEESGQKSGRRTEDMVEELLVLKKSLKSISSSEEYLKQKVERLESQNETQAIQLEKIKFDLDQKSQGFDTMKSDNNSLSKLLGSTKESNDELVGELNSLKQKYWILETERNELMKNLVDMPYLPDTLKTGVSTQVPHRKSYYEHES